MARGFDSKFVESQQEDAARRGPARPRLSAEELARANRKRTLELTRARAAADLEHATAPAHRRMLEQALAALDEQLQGL